MKSIMKIACLTVFIISFSLRAQVHEATWVVVKKEGYTLHYSENDTVANNIHRNVESGIKLVSSSLKKDFKHRIEIHLFPDRSLLDKQWQSAWNMPSFQSECWMVGSGVESRMDLLSPTTWDTQACDHDPNNQAEIRKLIHHELVHILHSDYNISPSFDDIHNIDWFVEGLATYISGQLDTERLTRTTQYIKDTEGPDELSMLWKGDHKYGLAGSMIAYIDTTYGRDTLSELMVHNDLVDILAVLDVSENELIAGWKKAILKQD